MAYALGRYSQGISVAKALAQGLGGKVKNALETTIKLAPKHADAHIALGAFHAEVIDKVGSLLGRTPGREQGRRAEDVPGRAEAQPGLGDRDGRVRQRPGDARGRQADEGSRPGCTRRPPPASRWTRWSGWTWRWRRRSWRTDARPPRRYTGAWPQRRLHRAPCARRVGRVQRSLRAPYGTVEIRIVPAHSLPMRATLLPPSSTESHRDAARRGRDLEMDELADELACMARRRDGGARASRRQGDTTEQRGAPIA